MVCTRCRRLGGPERLIAKDSAFPAYSPDGKWIAYIKGLPGSEGSGVFLTPAAGGPHRRLGTGLGLHWRPIW